MKHNQIPRALQSKHQVSIVALLCAELHCLKSKTFHHLCTVHHTPPTGCQTHPALIRPYFGAYSAARTFGECSLCLGGSLDFYKYAWNPTDL